MFKELFISKAEKTIKLADVLEKFYTIGGFTISDKTADFVKNLLKEKNLDLRQIRMKAANDCLNPSIYNSLEYQQLIEQMVDVLNLLLNDYKNKFILLDDEKIKNIKYNINKILNASETDICLIGGFEIQINENTKIKKLYHRYLTAYPEYKNLPVEDIWDRDFFMTERYYKDMFKYPIDKLTNGYYKIIENNHCNYFEIFNHLIEIESDLNNEKAKPLQDIILKYKK